MTDLPERLRRWTQARVALGRAGNALPTAALLDFELAHARARDAVHTALDAEALGLDDAVVVRSRAETRETYLQRPDLGRRLHREDEARLAKGTYDAALIVADGLSATAVHRHASHILEALRAGLDGWRLAPTVIARHARVALADEIGAALGADMTVLLIGERPGLSAPDSLGAYLTWAPKRGTTDSARNCVSNIRPPHGLSYEASAARILWLMREARARRLTGVALKEGTAVLPGQD